MKRADIVLVDWPFSDRTGSKLRPAVVIQGDFLNVLITDSVLVQITGKTRGAVTEVLLDPAVETASGLKQISFAVCNNIQTLDQALVHKRMGALTARAMREIEEKIKRALELP
jgi:mRNA interferase MazF